MFKKKTFFFPIFYCVYTCSLYCSPPNLQEPALPFQKDEVDVYLVNINPETEPHPLTPFCGKAPHPMRITSRHIEGKGIGYNNGYTTLEGFFTPLRLIQDIWLPFIDLRGHLFNDGKWAANAGFGFRSLPSSRVWGINAYYDFRQTHLQHYHQASIGMESLGRIWDFRLNGYLPFGKKTSALLHTQFSHFKGNSAYLVSRHEFAMKGIDAEAGYHWNRSRKYPVYVAFGPYYLEGQKNTAWGGQLRASLDWGSYFRFEANTSYDNIFKWIGQGQISINLPFGYKRKINQRKNSSCPSELILCDRLLQPVWRHEIIPTHRAHTSTKAIDPLTGKPYVFWFVDNTSHSQGTFESPFNSLVAAQNASSVNNVIYVYPGDGTTRNMDQGIVLQDNQRLWSSGTDQMLPTSLGDMLITAKSPSLPMLGNVLSSDSAQVAIVTVANANEISGFFFANSLRDNYGIAAGNNTLDIQGPSGISVFNNTFSSSADGFSAIVLYNFEKKINIHNNIFRDVSLGILILSDTAPLSQSVFIANNAFSNVDFSGIELYLGSGTINHFCILNNTINTQLERGYGSIQVQSNQGPETFGTIAGNSISNATGDPIYVGSFSPTTSPPLYVRVEDNLMVNTGDFVAQADGPLCLGLSGNTLDGRGAYHFIHNFGSFQVESSTGNLAGVESANRGNFRGALTSPPLTFIPVGTCPCSLRCMD